MQIIRPLLIAGFFTIFFAPLGIQAENSIGILTNHYVSSDGVSVFSPSTDMSLDLDSRTQVTMQYALDAVSAASFDYSHSKTHRNDPARATGNCFNCHHGVDAMSGATRVYAETRHQVDFGVKRKIGDADVQAGYTRSQENDYLSQSVSLGGDLSFFKRDTTLSLNAVRMEDASTPTWTRNITRGLSTNGLDLGLTQVLTPFSQVHLMLSYADAEGYLDDPYAFIEIGNKITAPTPARQPDSRQRGDFSAAFKQALGGNLSAEMDYRYYQDSWEVQAHTLDFALTKTFGDWMIEPSYRYYVQSQAFFFQNFYAVDQTYITRDLKLAAFSTQMFGVEITGKLTENWTLNARYTKYLRKDNLDYRLYYANGPTEGDIWQLGITLQ